MALKMKMSNEKLLVLHYVLSSVRNDSTLVVAPIPSLGANVVSTANPDG